MADEKPWPLGSDIPDHDYKVAHWCGSGGQRGVIYDQKVVEALEKMLEASREVPVVEDADLDEEKWLALAAPMTGVPKELWRCSFCNKVNGRDIETCGCGKDHGLCPIDGSYICEHGSEHDEWVE